jgi:hypothetical protein
MNAPRMLRPRTVRRLLFLAAISILLPTTDFGFVPEGGSHEQVMFAMEGVPVLRPVNLPEDALRVMRQNKTVLDCLEEGQSNDEVHGTWFIASEVHLTASGETHLVVMPSYSLGPSDGGCLLNAHTMPFWILAKRGRTYTILLEANAQVLSVLSTVSHGHQDILTTAANLNETTKWLYRFDGEKYILKKKTSIPQQ